MLSHGNPKSTQSFHTPVASHNYFQPDTFIAPIGNPHRNQDTSHEYLFQPVSYAMSRPASALSNASSSSSSMTQDTVFFTTPCEHSSLFWIITRVTLLYYSDILVQTINHGVSYYKAVAALQYRLCSWVLCMGLNMDTLMGCIS